MKAPNVLLTFLVLTLPVLSTAQQIQRSLPAEQMLDARKGGLTDFENYLYRFEVAHQENDLPSMEDIRVELLKIMDAEVSQLEKRQAAGNAPATLTARVDLQKSLLKGFKNQKLTTLQNPSSTDRPAFLFQLHQFREQMQAELQELEGQ